MPHTSVALELASMRHVILNCGVAPIESTESYELSALPTRSELKILNAITKEVLPEDPTPSLEEIAASPDVAHLGEPGFAPQLIDDPLRFIVHGDDAALAAIITRLMRIDAMWAEIAFLPSKESSLAQAWNLPADRDFAFDAPVKPKPLIRDDAGQAVAHQAIISDWDDKKLDGEIIVDDAVLLRGKHYGASLISTMDAPGVAGQVILSPANPTGLLAKFRQASKRADTIYSGRAMQAGGANLRISIDGVSRKRPVQRATFYRHLRDLQSVRL
ncbi:hypothetical protein CPELA_01415 [Corynebacterium pelargi]|uniref:Uncharacterized protein n=2 Tax=Corynebacterium pelargi TaxID=1471400 RepID=A0A410W6K7_9CORY|nr:hypothetical protein CPELA_01415 [Corynebacterium pelargi]